MKNTLLTFLLLCVTFTSFSQSLQEKFQRAKIYYSDSQQLSQLESLGVAVDHGKHKKGHFIISDFSTKELTIARDYGFKLEVLIDDLEQHFLTQNNLRVPLKNLECAALSKPIKLQFISMILQDLWAAILHTKKYWMS